MTHFGRVQADGAAIVPAELAREIGLNPEQHIRLDHEGEAVIVRTIGDVVRQSQQEFRTMIRRPFTVDEFIAGRRAAAEHT